jgi:hypothetical protein
VRKTAQGSLDAELHEMLGLVDAASRSSMMPGGATTHRRASAVCCIAAGRSKSACRRKSLRPGSTISTNSAWRSAPSEANYAAPAAADFC